MVRQQAIYLLRWLTSPKLIFFVAVVSIFKNDFCLILHMCLFAYMNVCAPYKKLVPGGPEGHWIPWNRSSKWLWDLAAKATSSGKAMSVINQ